MVLRCAGRCNLMQCSVSGSSVSLRNGIHRSAFRSENRSDTGSAECFPRGEPWLSLRRLESIRTCRQNEALPRTFLKLSASIGSNNVSPSPAIPAYCPADHMVDGALCRLRKISRRIQSFFSVRAVQKSFRRGRDGCFSRGGV